jgi:hypothetical protein
MIKFYVWQGEGVLQDYSSGFVLVPAYSEEEAWDTLLATNPAAYSQLQTGYSYVMDSDGNLIDEKEEINTNFPIYPEVYDASSLPAFIKWGGG